MSSNLIKTTPPQASFVPLEEPRQTVRPGAARVASRFLRILASLRLTVFLFSLSIILVFFGTLAQINNGIWTIVEDYFRSFWVWIPYQLAVQFGQVFFREWLPENLKIPGKFPFPGGWLIGSLLLVNLVAAHLTRFKLSWRRSGILLTHGGLILMMLGELITGLCAVEGNLVVLKGQSSNFLIHGRYAELAVVERSDAEYDNVVVIPAALLQPGSLIENDALPFDVRVEKYMKNSGIPKQTPEGLKNPATAGVGLDTVAVERPEVNGTDPDQKYDYPSAYVTFLEKGTQKSLGTNLVSILLTGEIGESGLQPVPVAGKTFEVGLRFKRSYKPYAVQLTAFKHDVYPGTEKPKDYRSTVRLLDPARSDDRKVEIYMNHPLRYRGETFYQSGVLGGDSGTILQVVRNPGWLLPYFSCFLVTLGLIVHFGMSLDKFLERGGDAGMRQRAQRILTVSRSVPWLARVMKGNQT